MPVNASTIPYLLAEVEAQQKHEFPTSGFTYGFDNLDTSTAGGNLSGLVSTAAKPNWRSVLCEADTFLRLSACCLDADTPSAIYLQFVNNSQLLATLPGIGVGQNLVTLAPCAVNQPHVHPRGNEISHVTKGEHCIFLLIQTRHGMAECFALPLPAGELFFGFVEESPNKANTIGGRFINATLDAGQTIIIPQGQAALASLSIVMYRVALCNVWGYTIFHSMFAKNITCMAAAPSKSTALTSLHNLQLVRCLFTCHVSTSCTLCLMHT